MSVMFACAIAMILRLLLQCFFSNDATVAVVGQDLKLPSCWHGGFSPDFCCNEEVYGPKGNPICWDSRYNFHLCCVLQRDELVNDGNSSQWDSEALANHYWDGLARADVKEEVLVADYVIIGSGSGGATLTAWLAEYLEKQAGGPKLETANDIIVIEAGFEATEVSQPRDGRKKNEKGSSPYENKKMSFADNYEDYYVDRIQEGHTTFDYVVGKAVGGSSAVNGRGWVRGNEASDFGYTPPLSEEISAESQSGWNPSLVKQFADEVEAKTSVTIQAPKKAENMGPLLAALFRNLKRFSSPEMQYFGGYEEFKKSADTVSDSKAYFGGMVNPPYTERDQKKDDAFEDKPAEQHENLSAMGFGRKDRVMKFVSAWHEYVATKHLNSKRVRLLDGVFAEKLIFEEESSAFSGGDKPNVRARGASCFRLQHRNSIGRFTSSEDLIKSIDEGHELLPERLRILARKEVIIAGGVLYTPQILFSSGIGKANELMRLPGMIPLLPSSEDNKELGKNLHDHTILMGMLLKTGLKCPGPWRKDRKDKNASGVIDKTVLESITDHARWMGLTGTRRGILDSDDEEKRKSLLKWFTDRDIEFTIVENCINDESMLRIKVWYFHHASIVDGQVSPRSSHPLAPPRTHGHRPCEDYDAIERVRLWVKHIFLAKILPAMQTEINDKTMNKETYGVESFVDGLVVEPETGLLTEKDYGGHSGQKHEMVLTLATPPAAALESPEAFRHYVDSFCDVARHLSGTCRMVSSHGATESGATGCVDSRDLKLKGLSNVRVADMSVLYNTHAHTDQLARVVGRMAAHLIINDEEKKREGRTPDSSLASDTLKNPIQKLSLPRIGTGTAGWRGDRMVDALSHWLNMEVSTSSDSEAAVNAASGTTAKKLHVDSAVMYKNMRLIHQALKLAGKARAEVFIATKIHPCRHFGYERTIRAITNELADLRSNYLDLVYIHHPGGDSIWKDYDCEQTSKKPEQERVNDWCEPEAVRYCEKIGWAACRMESWKALEYLYFIGKIRHAGVSSFAVWQMVPFVERARSVAADFGGEYLAELVKQQDPLLKPMRIAAHQLEFHPWWRPECVIEYSRRHNIEIVAFGSLGKGSLVGDHKSEYNPSGLNAPNSVTNDFPLMVQKFNKSPAQLLLKWALMKGVAIIPRSSNPGRMVENRAVEFENDLSSLESKILDKFYEKDGAMLYAEEGWRKNEPVAIEVDKFAGATSCQIYWEHPKH